MHYHIVFDIFGSLTSCNSSGLLQGNASILPLENGFNDSLSMLNSEKAVEEIIQQPILHGIDDHLIEFAETLRSMICFYYE